MSTKSCDAKIEGKASETAFLMDGMLGSLTRKLRILGFDTLYDSTSDDGGLLKIAKETKRYLVTSDSELFLRAKRRKINSILVRSRTESGRLYEVLSGIGLSKLDLAKSSRCSECNGLLETSKVDNHSNKVFRCVDCGKEYWKGSHWKKLQTLFNEVDNLLQRKKADMP